jgi:hypothetical protein
LLAKFLQECQNRYLGFVLLYRKAVVVSFAKDNIDYRLLNRLSNLVICSRCLRRGKITPVPQVISGRHSLTNECPSCRHERAGQNGYRRAMGKLLILKR